MKQISYNTACKNPDISHVPVFHKLVLLLFFALYFSCTLPLHPDRPENALGDLIVRSSPTKIDQTLIEASIDSEVAIGCIPLYQKYIDSIQIRIIDQSINIQIDSFTLYKKEFIVDTIWKSYVFKTSGTKKIYSTTYIRGYDNKYDSATINILGKIETTRKTSLKIEGTRSVVSGDTCLLILSVDSTDSLVMYNKPDSAILKDSLFIWKTPSDSVGYATLIISAFNKKIPQYSDTDSVKISFFISSPITPSHFYITKPSPGVILLHWDTIPSAQTYYIHRSDSAKGPFTIIDSSKQTSFEDFPGSNQVYYFLTASTSDGVLSTPSDTLVSSDTVNQPPQWTSKLISESTIADTLFSLDIKKFCYDREDDSILFTIESSTLKNDSIINGVYHVTPAVSDTGNASILIVAADTRSRKDSLVLILAIKNKPIQIILNPIGTVTAGVTKSITGNITSEQKISSITCTITTSANTKVDTSMISCWSPTVKNVQSFIFKNTSALKIISSKQAKPGKYKLNVTIKTDSITMISTLQFSIQEPPVDTLKIKTATLGFQKNIAGSSLDINAMNVYTQKQTKDNATIQEKVDLYFSYASSAGTAKMEAPSAAKGLVPFIDGWSKKKSTQMLKVNMPFENIKTQTAIESLWNKTVIGSNSMSFKANDVFVVKTQSGTYHLLKIVSVKNSIDGSAKVIGRIK